MTGKVRMMAVLEKEFEFIALQAVSSNKAEIRERIFTEVSRYMTRKGFTYENGVPRETLLSVFSNVPINSFAQIVSSAESIDKFREDISNLMLKDNGQTDESWRRKTWRKIERSFGVQWKFKFEFPKHLYDQKVNSRTWKRKKSVTPTQQPTIDPMLSIPQEIREYIQKLEHANQLQKKLIMCILDNPLTPAIKGARLEVEKGLFVSFQQD